MESNKKTTFGPYSSRLAARSANCTVSVDGKCISGRLVKNCDQWWRVLKCTTYPYRDGQWLADVEMRAANEAEMAEIAEFLTAKRSDQEYNGNYIDDYTFSLDFVRVVSYYRDMSTQQQPTVRQINDHTFAGTGTCMVYADGFQMRISRARTHKGVKQGRVINYSYSGRNAANVGPVSDWEPIPADATVMLVRS